MAVGLIILFVPFYWGTIYLWLEAWKSYKMGDRLGVRMALASSLVGLIPSLAGIALLVEASTGGPS
ncbi:hypothetical protein [Cohaesibacter gelatinilyticus]|uniref:Uncharacterized protein n=1 Tax=Cohaesibacter gelatinilyticus TaxID=372072 RepID=A0A285PIW9_9HYPH|nr:hypothetical protein [Cohaesibacter gelatinilyticus]SNZ21669.1 hypothetical protein SAMN06265368_4794 [Cohaesibacter gelatinilyticus]